METHATPEDLVDRTIGFAKKLNKSKEEKRKIISLMVLLLDKYLTREKVLSIWEGIIYSTFRSSFQKKQNLKIRQELGQYRGKVLGRYRDLAFCSRFFERL